MLPSMGRGCPLPIGEGSEEGQCPLPGFFFNFWFSNVYFGAFCVPFEYLLLHCVHCPGPSRTPMRLLSLTLQADRDSFKHTASSCRRTLSSLVVTSDYATNLVIANVKTLSHDGSNSHSFTSDKDLLIVLNSYKFFDFRRL